MSKIFSYFEESFNELFNKVSWPSWKELQSSAILVMVSSLIIALIVYLMDKSFSEILKLFYNEF
jgi:preprotein translocase subunit SecE